MKHDLLKSVRIRNFKAIRNSGVVKLTTLTVLVGNNGSGKSSLVEAFSTLQRFVKEDLDAAMNHWGGMEHIRNKAGRLGYRGAVYRPIDNPMEIRLVGRSGGADFVAHTIWKEAGEGQVIFDDTEGLSRIAPTIREWQFLNLHAQSMGEKIPLRRARNRIRLVEDGSNVAEVLLDIRRRDQVAFDGIIETLRYVLPYADDLQPKVTSELERLVYLQLHERGFDVPGWLLSTGTLRILALLCALRHPEPAPLLIIEEAENGLDPRSIHLLASELHDYVTRGIGQVILTTHSPYLMDLLPLSCLVFVERVKGEPTFRRPSNDRDVREWSREFSPGQLYTMSRFSRAADQ
jgi:predicted ATPase